MGTKKHEWKGTFEETTGEAKRRVGRAVGNEQMELEGEARSEKGRGRKGLARAAGQLKGAARKALGRAQRKLAGVVGNRSKQAKGAGRHARGEIEQEFHRGSRS